MHYLALLVISGLFSFTAPAFGNARPDIVISDIQFKDNMNSKVTFEPGQLIEMIVTLEATNRNVFNVSAKVSINDPCLNFSQNNASYGALIVGKPQNNATNPFVFTVLNDCKIQNKEFALSVVGSDNFSQTINIIANDENTPQAIEDVFYKVEVQAINGHVTKTPDLDKYPDGSQVKLAAFPNSNYKFSGWTGSVEVDSDTLGFTVDHDKILIANFTPINDEAAKTSVDAPIVNAGEDQTITLPLRSILKATTSLDEKRGVKVFLWCKLTGPGPVVFANPYSLITTAAFKVPGTYELLLTAVDKSSGNSGNSKITITVKKDEQDGKFLSVF